MLWSKSTIGTGAATATGVTATATGITVTAIAHTIGPMATGMATDDPITGTAVTDPIGVRALIFGSASRLTGTSRRTFRLCVLAYQCRQLRARGVRLLASNGDYLTDDTDEMTEGCSPSLKCSRRSKRSALSVSSRALVSKRVAVGKCEGRKSLAEINPEMVALAPKLRRKRPKGGQLSLRGVSKELAAQGYLNERGNPYAAKSVASMLRAA